MLKFLKLLFPVQVSSLNVIFHILKHEPDPLYIYGQTVANAVLKLAAMCICESRASFMSDRLSATH